MKKINIVFSYYNMILNNNFIKIEVGIEEEYYNQFIKYNKPKISIKDFNLFLDNINIDTFYTFIKNCNYVRINGKIHKPKTFINVLSNDSVCDLKLYMFY